MAKDSVEEEKTFPTSESEDVLVTAVPVSMGGTAASSEPLLEVLEETPEQETFVVTEQEPGVEAGAEKPGERGEVVKSASLVALGNLGSSVLGMIRQSFIASTGAAISGPFLSAISPAQKFNDFIINGAVPGALIPTFNDYAGPDKREELRRLVFTIVNLIFLVMSVSSVLYFFIAPWFVNSVLASGYTPSERLLTLQFTRIIFFSLLALGPFSALQAALYAQKEFGWTSVATAAYHGGIIVGAIVTVILGRRYFGEYALAFGVILGTVGEIALLIPGMRRTHLKYMFVLDLKHPALHKVLKLYGPVAISFFVTACFAFLDQYFATQTPCAPFMSRVQHCGDVNFSAMNFATLLIQFPGGLVASALSFAVLPTLTTHIREGEMERFKGTLLLGFRLGLLLMIPAAAGLIVLQMPIVNLLFHHGSFTSDQALLTGTALQNYSYQLPFLAIDQLLIAAFYARKNTLIPVTVGAVSVLGYLAVALPFWKTVGMPALPLANSVQNTTHALILLVLLRMAVGSLNLTGILPALLKILLATAVMFAVAWGLQSALAHVSLFSLNTFYGSLLTVLVAGGIAAVVYFGLVVLLKVEEVTMLKGALMAKLGKK
ncbi:MAG: hypothetical protein H0U76_16600 [Ktedonobacteraceae bacterium]|nr:hypothetical protein [Ktedonobacteraceae bacterium]